MKSKKQRQKNNKLLLITIILPLFIFLITLGFSLRYLLVSNSSSTTQEELLTELDLKQTIFYVENNNIFAGDIETNQDIKLTDYPEERMYSISDIKVIDNNTLGFSSCETRMGNFGCGLYVLDLGTKQVSLKKELERNMLILTSDWYSADTFSYLVTAENKWQFYLQTENENQLLEDLTIGSYGRGGSNEDSEKISFSPDGKYLLQISTSSARDIADYNIYLYEIGSGNKQVIANATQPEWIDETRILYKNVAPSKRSFSIYDLSDSTNIELNGVLDIDNAYNPKVIRGESKVLYQNTETNQVLLYDLDTGKSQVIAEYASQPIWLDKNKIMFSDMELCKINKPCNSRGNVQANGVAVYNLDTQVKKELPFGLKYAYQVSTQYDY